MPLSDRISNKDQGLSVHFTCQRCSQPLKLHSSLSEPDYQTLSEFSFPNDYPNENCENECAIFESYQNQRDKKIVMRKVGLPVKFADADSDFLVVDHLSNLSLEYNQSFKVTTARFNIISDQSAVDHPICQECCDNLHDQMDDNLKLIEEDHKEYGEFLPTLEASKQEDDLEEQKAELVRLQERVAQLQLELSITETQQIEMRDVLRVSKEEYEVLQREEYKCDKNYCRIQQQYFLMEDRHRNSKRQVACAQAQLDKLKPTNVFSSLFRICNSGNFGTINGFRLGTLRDVPVRSPEINAAWGQTVLLLRCLARKVGLTFERYHLVPYGNHSYIESLENKSSDLPLYTIGGFIYNSKFDLAMIAFLDCLQQFKEKVESEAAKMAFNDAKSFQLPYKMDKGKIEDSNKITYSIKIQFNSEKHWTRALKLMLTNLKWALSWVSSQSHFFSAQGQA